MTERLPFFGESPYYDVLTGWLLEAHNADGTIQSDALSDLSVTATGGSAIRTLSARFAERINVLDYGATGLGVADDAAGIQAAFNAVTSTGDEVYFPPGLYLCSVPITHTNKPIAVSGAGMGISEVRFTGATGGFAFTFDDVTDALTIHDLSITTTAAGAGNAISADWPTVASSTFRTARLFNLDIRGLVIADDYWTQGIVLADAWNSDISHCHFLGRAHTFDSDTAIRLSGMSIDVGIAFCNIYFFDVGIVAEDQTEGITITDTSIVYARVGVAAITPVSAPLVSVTNSHISVFETAVALDNRTQSVISGNTIYKRPDSSSNFIGINLANDSDMCRIIGNYIIDPGSIGGTKNGVVVASAENAVIMGNGFALLDTGVVIQAGGTNCIVTSNYRNGGSTFISDSGTGTVTANNIT